MEANIFSIDPRGFKVHWKLTPEEGMNAERFLNHIQSLCEDLDELGFSPDRMASSTPSKPTPEEESGPRCPRCGGAMWDNRKDKKNPRAPDYRCKDPDCPGRIWPERH